MCVFVGSFVFDLCIFFYLVSFNMEKYLRTRQLLIDLDGERPIPRLREPLDLFSIPSISHPFQGVRWPIECEVICDKIHHIGMYSLCFSSGNCHTSSFNNNLPVYVLIQNGILQNQNHFINRQEMSKPQRQWEKKKESLFIV